jgi:glycosyltransferase involved in cell wall biosynthesis
VLESVLRRLGDPYDVHLLGIGYGGRAQQLDGVTLHPTNLAGGDVFGAFRAAELARELDAGIVLLLNDLWMLHSYMRTLPALRNRLAIIAYVPLDGTIVSERPLSPLGPVDRFVAASEFGRRELSAALAALDRPAHVTAIPHGVDTATFRPLPGGRAQARGALFGPEERDWHEAFIVLNANRPHERKRIDLTIEGFALFAAGKPESVKLWLHHAHMDDAQYRALLALAERHGIAGRLRITAPGAPVLSDEALNLVYNACDVGLNTAMGEGFGLVSFEHAAAGAAQVVPDCSACGELWKGAAELVASEDSGVPPWSMLSMRTVSARGVAAALQRLYRDPQHLRGRSHAARRNATQPHYCWNAVAARWRALFDGLTARSSSAGAAGGRRDPEAPAGRQPRDQPAEAGDPDRDRVVDEHGAN